MDDKSVETTELVLKVIDYAHEHNLDVNNIEDVKKILKALNSDLSTDSEIREFMVLIKATDTFFDMNAPQKTSEKQKLLN